MPSIKTITPILGGNYYHIFNRGINRNLLFFQEKNYIYFLGVVKEYMIEYVDVLAYCLLPNHFHLIIKVKQEIYIPNGIALSSSKAILKGSSIITDEIEIGKIVSNQFKKMFIKYAMAINKQEHRVGALFDAKFKRLEITQHEYLEYAIFYTNYNAEKHGLVKNFRDYKFSSFKALLSNNKTTLNRKLVHAIYGSKENFISYHNSMHTEKSDVVIE